MSSVNGNNLQTSEVQKPESDNTLEVDDLLNTEENMDDGSTNCLKELISTIKKDPNAYICTDEYMESIKPSDGTVELVARVCSKERIVTYSNEEKNETHRLLKFEIETNKHTRYEVAVWSDEIQKFASYIEIDNILYFERLFAKYQEPRYCKNKFNYILTVRSSTTCVPIHIEEKKNTVTADESDLKVYELLDEAVKGKGNFKFGGVVKTEFHIQSEGLKSKHAFGVISDMKSKIPTKIYNYYKPDFNLLKGEYVILTGHFDMERSGLVLIVASVDDITKCPEKNVDPKLLNTVNKTLKRPVDDAGRKEVKRVKIESEK